MKKKCLEVMEGYSMPYMGIAKLIGVMTTQTPAWSIIPLMVYKDEKHTRKIRITIEEI